MNVSIDTILLYTTNWYYIVFYLVISTNYWLFCTWIFHFCEINSIYLKSVFHVNIFLWDIGHKRKKKHQNIVVIKLWICYFIYKISIFPNEKNYFSFLHLQKAKTILIVYVYLSPSLLSNKVHWYFCASIIRKILLIDKKY